MIIKSGDVYYPVKYAAVVQIDYEASTLDSSNSINENNFGITDCNNRAVDWDVDAKYTRRSTDDKSIVVGLLEVGEIRIDFSFHSNQVPNCKIICKYDNDTKSYILKDNETPDYKCPSCNKNVDEQDKYCRYCGKGLK